MNMIGWSASEWAPGTTAARYDPQLLTSLAGNAYSAFAASPMAMLAVALAGATREMFGVQVELPDVMHVTDSESASSECNE